MKNTGIVAMAAGQRPPRPGRGEQTLGRPGAQMAGSRSDSPLLAARDYRPAPPLGVSNSLLLDPSPGGSPTPCPWRAECTGSVTPHTLHTPRSPTTVKVLPTLPSSARCTVPQQVSPGPPLRHLPTLPLHRQTTVYFSHTRRRPVPDPFPQPGSGNPRRAAGQFPRRGQIWLTRR